MKATGFVGVYDPFLDVTQQRIDRLALESAAETQGFLLKLTDAQSSAANGREIMQISAELLGRHLNVGRVGYSEDSPDQTSMSCETGWAQGELETLSGSVPLNHWSEGTSSDFSRGRTVVYPDVRREPSLASEVENYIAIGAISVIASPFLRGGMWRCSLYVNHWEPRQWTEQEVILVEEVARRTAAAVDRAQAEEELRALAERLRMAQQAGRMASWQWDFATDTLIWDGGSEWMYCRPPAQMKTPEMIFSYIHADDREKVHRDLIPAMEGRGEYRSEFRVFWPDGSLHWILAFGKTVWTAAGVPCGVVGININVTEQKMAGTALLQNEKLAAVGRLATTIAHEINNPLESVTNLIFLARSAPNVPAEIQEYMETADRELRRVGTIVSQTLRFHRQATNPVVCSGRKLLHDTISIYQGRTINSYIDVFERHRSAEGIKCFEGEIRQVLSNLIANAIDAMPHGGRLLLRSRAATHSSTGRPGLTLTIADTGTGMSSTVKERIFEAFYSTKGIGGTGLGLWISRDIVDRHHGMLAVRSSQKVGRSGTVFSLFLPADAENR